MILDLHIHTSWHSADSNLSPIELIREAKRLGLDGVVVTEHDRGWDRFRARELATVRIFARHGSEYRPGTHSGLWPGGICLGYSTC